MPDERVTRLHNEIAELRARVLSLQARPMIAAPTGDTPPLGSPSEFASRRGMLKLAGAAIAGAVATTAVTGISSATSAAAVAPSFHPIRPIRVYDSRVPMPKPGPLSAPQTRDISVADGRRSRIIARAQRARPGGRVRGRHTCS